MLTDSPVWAYAKQGTGRESKHSGTKCEAGNGSVSAHDGIQLAHTRDSRAWEAERPDSLTPFCIPARLKRLRF